MNSEQQDTLNYHAEGLENNLCTIVECEKCPLYIQEHECALDKLTNWLARGGSLE